MRIGGVSDASVAAVVTGGGSGIGTMIAAAYVQNGAKVYIASRKEQQLKEVSVLPLVIVPSNVNDV